MSRDDARAQVIDLVNLVVMGDALVKMFDICPDRLLTYCRTSERHHSTTASLAASYVRSGLTRRWRAGCGC